MPPRAGFALLVTPDNRRLGKGDTALLGVTAVRKDGFGSEIRVTARDMPPGFIASEAVIPAGQESARLAMTAPAGAVKYRRENPGGPSRQSTAAAQDVNGRLANLRG